MIERFESFSNPDNLARAPDLSLTNTLTLRYHIVLNLQMVGGVLASSDCLMFTVCKEITY